MMRRFRGRTARDRAAGLLRGRGRHPGFRVQIRRRQCRGRRGGHGARVRPGAAGPGLCARPDLGVPRQSCGHPGRCWPGGSRWPRRRATGSRSSSAASSAPCCCGRCSPRRPSTSRSKLRAGHERLGCGVRRSTSGPAARSWPRWCMTALFVFVVLGVTGKPRQHGHRGHGHRAVADRRAPHRHPDHRDLGEPGAQPRARADRRRDRAQPGVAVHRGAAGRRGGRAAACTGSSSRRARDRWIPSRPSSRRRPRTGAQP